MSFYLKYRPKKVAELDLVVAREALEALLSSGKYVHAYLFAGPAHIGKTTVAKNFVNSLICENLPKGKGPVPCGQCQCCRQLANKIHPDVFWLSRESDEKTEKLKYVAGIVTRNLNNVIDINYYPVDKAKVSNLKHRPIGIGIQGLADVYCLMELPYDSEEARIVNRKISETIYFGALTMSNELAIKHGPYTTFNHNGGCPFSKGQLQWQLSFPHFRCCRLRLLEAVRCSP